MNVYNGEGLKMQDALLAGDPSSQPTWVIARPCLDADEIDRLYAAQGKSTAFPKPRPPSERPVVKDKSATI